MQAKPLRPGSTVLAPDGTAFPVDEAFASAFQPGDRVIAIRAPGCYASLVKTRRRLARRSTAPLTRSSGWDRSMTMPSRCSTSAGAPALADAAVWREIAAVNATDVDRAPRARQIDDAPAVSADMREKMIEGMRGWASTPSRRGALLETIHQDGFRVEMVGAALGVVAFVVEGRPNVLADACGVLRGGNTVVFRIGSDALATARSIMRLAIDPALAASGLPKGTVRWWTAPRTRRVGRYFSISGCRSRWREVPVRPSSCSARWLAVSALR